MAENPVLGEAPIERLLERIDIVNPLADERAFAEQVLVDIGDGARIGIDARLAAAQPRIPRPVGARQAHRHARLQDAVALGDALPVFVDTAARFSGCAMAPTNCRAASRGSCVSVSSVMTYFTPGKHCRLADDEREAIPVWPNVPPRSSEFNSASLPRLRS